MKWHKYYDYLRIRVEDIGDVDEFLWLIAANETIKADLVIKGLKEHEEGQSPPSIVAEESVGMIITKIEPTEGSKKAGVFITFKTNGLLPEGVCHGIYTAKFNGSGTTDPLPKEMFEDDEVPKEAVIFASQ
ncbi:hypothetical protein GWN26_14915 [Candidatus Saccharibacteria bacterium]|nr:hypothetical protein [Candidatus Saccharibacteria bacterium]NIV04467.1 hypothetical protein [Calditrichia bacterium]NIS39025.1 hypothetical protein [Candidatus Saccharibacteria bacterium]NIV73061.1 hypothetical protein [Calditrichia bacterium]NIW00334.1 hypothetical protein [Candidatus Saccharibacteria bacterium]